MSEQQKNNQPTKSSSDFGPIWGDMGSSGSGNVKTSGNRVYFFAPINDSNILELAQALKKVEIELKKQQVENSCLDPYIELHIQSYGGSYLAGLAGLEMVRNCSVPVYTHVNGAAASAATLLSVVGKKRKMYKESYILIHQISSSAWGTYENIKDTCRNLEEFMTQVKKIYSKYTKIPVQRLEEILKHDLWLNSSKCLEYGLVDEVI